MSTVSVAGEQLVGRAVSGGLPAETTALVGRDAEVERIHELLDRADVRLVTLTGPGGVGKSRLGLRAASVCAEAFTDGVGFVSLGALRDPQLVGSEIAAVLGLAEAGDRAPLDRVIAHLAEREMLLLLDGFEQLLAAAGLIADLLAACPQLTLLVTSRAALEVAGEHEFRVPPLAAPQTSEAGRDPQSLTRFPAVSLFVQRARAVQQEFQLTPEGVGAVGEICRRLDGLPLAIELAAARVRLLPPEAMVARLDRRLELLTGGRRDAPRRQQTMREAVAWSYDLLAAEEQRLFRLLSVFAGGSTLDAVEAVAADDGGTDVSVVVESLLAQSMLVALGGPDQPRVGMLETLRAYASEALDAAGERGAAEQAHAAWCRDFARAADAGLWGPEQRIWLERVERELPNLRAASRRLLDDGRGDEAAELAVALERYWLMRGDLAEGRAWIEESLATGPDTSCARARALSLASTLASRGGDLKTARALGDRALDVARESGGQEELARALCAAAYVARTGGDLAGAMARFDEAIAILRTLDRPARLAETLAGWGSAAIWQGPSTETGDSFDTAMTYAGEALELSRAAGDVYGAVYASCCTAWVMAVVDGTRATLEIEDLLATCRASGVGRTTSRLVFLLGVIALRSGDPAGARAHLEEAAAIAAEFGDSGFLTAFCLPSLARAHLLAGRPDDAARLLAAADRALVAAGRWLPRWMQSDDGGGVEAMRAALADPRHDAARAQGAALGVAEALAFARAIEASGAPADDELRALTTRELEVLRLLTREFTDAQIAQELVVSRRTVHAHLRSIYRKLDVTSRTAAARWAAEHGLVRP